MVTVQWFGFELSGIALVGIIAATFLLCVGLAWTIGKVARLRVGAITMALGGGSILFALVVVGGIWFAYYALGSSQ